jgi:glycosyltransferase involved in cell wall biosynthesis
MRILIANHHYFDLTGTETFVYTLAKSLKTKGSSVTIYAPYIGGLIVQKTKELGIAVVDDLKLINTGDFDIAHVSHNLIAYKIRAWSLDIPMVFLSHGILPFLEQPPVDDLNISAYLSVSEEVRDNLIGTGVAREKILIFRNIIDTARFHPGSPINPSPQRALINSRRIDADTRAIIEAACARLQINLVSIGDTGKVAFDVEKAINEVDIVFSLGRGILESMSCGRASIVLDYNGGDGIVTPANIDEIQKCNFSGRRFGLKFDSDTLVAEIRKYSQELGKIGRDIIIDRFSSDKNVDKLLILYKNAIESFETAEINERALNQLVNIIHETHAYSVGTLSGAYESKIRNYEQTAKTLQCIREQLEAGLKDKDAQLLNINSELLQQEKALAERNNRLIETSQELNEIKNRFKSKCAEADEKDRALTHALEENKNQRMNFDEELRKRDFAMSKMEQERNAERAKLNNLYDSYSWRITAPLRKVHELLMKCSPKGQKKEAEHSDGKKISAIKIIRNISYITKMYDFRQAIPNIREYGLKTFLRNARMEFTRENVIDISVNQKKSNGPDLTENKTSNEIHIEPQDTCNKTNAYFNFLFEANNCREKDYVPISYPNLAETDIKLIAFYLPQFHPIPENDEWWGKGFTEWTNVSKAIPQFIGHYQPRLPGELGFYDLRLPEVQKRQIELARQYGIYGFCFHFYWFKSGQVLERPLEQFLESKDLDFPFCINWANESWSRRWDGKDNDILLEQNHSTEDDIEFIKYVSRLFSDSRYIRIQGKPLLIIYRPSLFPNLRETAAVWRDYCRKNGIGEIYLALTHSFEYVNPEKIGFDAAIEFAPNTFLLKPINDEIEFTNPDFNGIVYDYNSAVNYSKVYPMPDYKKFRCIFPGWDNEARKPGSGSIFHRTSPQSYKEWLEYLCTYTRQNFSKEERFIFINAWNEWAEGAYLEPDRKYGYAYLHKTAEALASFPEKPTVVPGKWKILFVSHDACRGGAQLVFLNIISWIKKYTSVDLKILCLDKGEWLSRFRELGDTIVLSDLRKDMPSEEALIDRLLELNDGPPDLIYGNSVAAGREYRLLHRLNVPIITHFHELEMSIKKYAGDWIKDVLKYSSHIIACSGAVRENLAITHKVDRSKITTVFECITPDSSIQILNNAEKCQEREKLGLEKDKFIIFGCGIGMVFRKGADLFIEVARILSRKGLKNFHFYWIGDFDVRERSDRHGHWADHLSSLKKDGLKEHVTFLGLKDNPREYLRTGDIFLLPSREDPFPLVTLEAAECGLPVICFANAGGIPEFVEEDAGFVVPYENVEAMAKKVALLIENEDLRRRLGVQAREKLLSRFTFEQTSPHIFSISRSVAQKKPTVSVIVPNYNHARYLPRRLDSIFGQTFKDFEVILLDDASTDDSMKVLEQYAHHADVQVVKNENNTGSPCTQWLKGIDLAKADIFWVAESDDVCEPDFLETLIREFRNPSVKLTYADSYVIDENDVVTGDYLNCEYLTSLSKTKWRKNYQIPATEEINDGLGVKNTILNISAVLFRKFNIEDNFRKVIEGMRIAGDWYFITHAIRNGNVHYVAKKLNYHRRHPESVIGRTVADKKIEDFFREFYTVQQFIFHNYKLANGFHEKWERYLRKQWNDFYPNRPFEELKNYYPFDEMKEMHFLKSETI